MNASPPAAPKTGPTPNLPAPSPIGSLIDMPTKKLTAKAFISGLWGIVVLHLGGFWLVWTSNHDGLTIGGWHLTDSRETTTFMLLVVTALSMFIIEMGIRLYYERSNFLALHPKIKEGRPAGLLGFIAECLFWYGSFILLLLVVQSLYENAYEYSYAAHSGKYKPWFVLLDEAIRVLIWTAGPYILLTRALQYNAQWDRKEPVVLFWKFFLWLLAKSRLLVLVPEQGRRWLARQVNDNETANLPGLAVHRSFAFNKADSQTLLGMFVKAFYIPLMSIFFIDQSSSLFKNWEYILHHLDTTKADYTFRSFSNDFYNISFTFIFVIDVGLAWCGYVFSSRWIKNGLKSVEPTFIGWAVAIFCYPPFNSFLHSFYSPPSDKDFLKFEYDGLVFVLICLSICSYFLYMSATVCFGLRFSNLTNRGIINTGPFRYIRHPAYTGKNISWWLVMLPVIIIQCIENGSWVPGLQLIGLVVMTTLYYYRAITEERHLINDPDYVEYCKQVPWRFIPKVI